MNLKSPCIPALLLRGVLLAAFAVSAVGCISYAGYDREQAGVGRSATGAYFRNRAMDARDVFTITAMAGAVNGVKAQVGPIGVGLFIASSKVFAAEYGLLQGEPGLHPSTNDTTIILGPIGRYRLEAKDTRAQDRKKHINSRYKYPASAYTRLGVAAGACVGLCLEFNPGELLDFLLGLVGIDIFEDDVYQSAPKKDAGT